jgi:hypothetical protein
MSLSDMTEPELREVMIAAIRSARSALPAGTQIIMLAMDESNIAQYIATVERSSVVQVLRETADRLERREDVTR